MTSSLASRQTLIEKFEQLWREGQQPDPLVVLGTDGAWPADLLASVLAVDQWQRWQHGQRLSAEDYLRRWPELASDQSACLELIYGEFMVRHALGEEPAQSEYLDRFPQFAAALGEQFVLFEALEKTGQTSPNASSPHERTQRSPALSSPRLAQDQTRCGEDAVAPKPADDNGDGITRTDLREALPDETPYLHQADGQQAGIKEKSALGTSVPGYEILGELGRGGMGVVYKARDVKLNRLVAIKMILGGIHASTEELTRFLVEAETVAQVQHANIVSIFEVGRCNDLPYIALEFVSGGSLAHHSKGVPLPPGRAARLVEQLAHGAQAAHQRGIVHRDLKPGNVLLAADGTPKIADFGLAKRLQAGDGLTVTGAIVGTPSYMAPEQADSKKSLVGPGCDVYALGAILYELLTGRPPFHSADPLDTLHQVCHDEPVPPRQVQSKTPKDLETVCLKCLQKEPAKRYATAQALAEDLARFQAGKPVLARPVGRLERTWRWCRRNPVVAGLTAATALLLVLLATGSSIAAVMLGEALTESQEQRHIAQLAEKDVKKQRDDALANLQRAQAAERNEQEAKKEALDQLAKAYLEQARAKALSGRMGQRFDSLDAIKKAMALTGPTLQLRNAALACLVLPDARVLPRRTISPHNVSPDLQRFALWDNDTHVLQIGQMSDNRMLPDLSLPGVYEDIHGGGFSPDSQLFGVVCNNGHYRIWRLGADAATLLLEGKDGHGLTFSGDSCQVAVGNPQTKTCRILNIADKRQVLEIKVESAFAVAFHPLLARLAVVEPALTRIIDVETGKESARWPTPGTYSVGHLAWHPTGRLLAVARGDQFIHVYDPATKSEVVPHLVAPGGGLRLCFTQSGDALASNSTWQKELRLWDAWTGRQLFKARVGANTSFHFSKDDRLLAFGEDGLLEMALGRELRVLRRPVRGDQAGYGAARVTKNGQLLAANTEEGLALLELYSGRELAHVPLSHAVPMVFDSTDALWLNRREGGVERWPVRLTSDKVLEYGPPQKVVTGFAGDLVGFGKDGQVLAFPQFSSAQVFHRGQTPIKEVRLENLLDCRFCAVSPDGRLVAAGNHWHGGIFVFEASTGKLVKGAPKLGGWSGFSPDGRWLAVQGRADSKDDMQILEVGTWKQWPLGSSGSFAFAPDSRSIAVSTGYGAIRVLRVPTGEELYRLQVAEQTSLDPQCFTADGAQLIANCGGSLYVFDLRTLRQELRTLGLDWEELEFPPAPPTHPPLTAKLRAPFFRPPLEPPAKTVERATAALLAYPDDSEAYHFRAHAYEELGKFIEAEADFTQALKHRPTDGHLLTFRGWERLRLLRYEDAVVDLAKALDHRPPQDLELAWACTELAWVRLVGPNKLRDAKAAQLLAERAIGLAPKKWDGHAALALAHYQQDHLDQARLHVEASVAVKGKTEAVEWCVLALLHAKKGEAEKARDCLTQAAAWAKDKDNGKALAQHHQAMLATLLAEVEAALQMTAPDGQS